MAAVHDPKRNEESIPSRYSSSRATSALPVCARIVGSSAGRRISPFIRAIDFASLYRRIWRNQQPRAGPPSRKTLVAEFQQASLPIRRAMKAVCAAHSAAMRRGRKGLGTIQGPNVYSETTRPCRVVARDRSRVWLPPNSSRYNRAVSCGRGWRPMLGGTRDDAPRTADEFVERKGPGILASRSRCGRWVAGGQERKKRAGQPPTVPRDEFEIRNPALCMTRAHRPRKIQQSSALRANSGIPCEGRKRSVDA